MTTQTIIPAEALPIDLNAVKQHLRVDGTEEDELIRSLILAATEYAENFTRRALVSQKVRHYDDSGKTIVELQRNPLQAIDTVTADDVVISSTGYDLYTADEREPMELINGYSDSLTVDYWAGYATPFTAVASTDVITLAGVAPVAGTIVRLSNSGGTLPGGLAAYHNYYIVNASGQTCKLSNSVGGTAIDITSIGTGTNYIGVIPSSILAAIKLMVGHWYENRESVNVGNIVNEFPMSVRDLLIMNRWGDYQ